MDKDKLAAHMMAYSNHIKRTCDGSNRPVVSLGRATMRDVAECLTEAAAALRSHAPK